MRLLIVADCHANWPALRAVAEQEAGADAVVGLGDLVINGPLPREVIAWHRERADWVVRGNHDDTLLAAAAGEPLLVSGRPAAFAERQAALLAPDELAWLRDLPQVCRFEFGGARFCAVHGSMSRPANGTIRPDTDPLLLRAELDQARADFLLVGHTHRPLLRTYRGVTVANPGALGKPIDGDPRTQYAIWEDGVISFHRLVYDVEETCRAMEQADCPPEYIPGLVAGWRQGLPPGGPVPVKASERARPAPEG